ncbi:MAG: FMN-binding protein, partial [Kiritimatiellae bacterium]|nr:FMN-binding protein [Kiritimatiellia bacterium]
RVRRDGGEIDAVTSATISSRAACEAVAAALPRLRAAMADGR